MPETTPRLLLPFILAAQAQKHVTHNEALRQLDGIVQLAVASRAVADPPASPDAGAAYIVPTGATGLWAGWDGDVAYFDDGGWMRLGASDGWRAYVAAEGALCLRSAGAWVAISRAAQVDVARGALGASTGMGVIEEVLGDLAGAEVTSTIVIPDRAIVLGVSTRTLAEITGAASYDCGIAGEQAKFGGSLGVAEGSENRGVIGPEAFYAPAPIRLTANGGAFTGGAVLLAIHYLTVGLPA